MRVELRQDRKREEKQEKEGMKKEEWKRRPGGMQKQLLLKLLVQISTLCTNIVIVNELFINSIKEYGLKKYD